MKTVKTTPSVAHPANGPLSLMERLRAWEDDPVMRRIRPKGIPWFCQDEESKMGESTVHTLSTSILHFGLTFHFALLAGFRVFANLNLYFSQEHPNLYLTPDVMVVQPPRPLPAQLASYRIGEQGPAPVLVGEVLSPRTYQEGDLTGKPLFYGEMGVPEYLLADVTGELLPQRLLLLRRQRKGRWQDEQDADGGITSRLGFRIVIEDDGQLRIINAQTSKRYARPDEAQAATDKAQAATDKVQAATDKVQALTDRVHALEEESARLREALAKEQKRKGRRRKP